MEHLQEFGDTVVMTSIVNSFQIIIQSKTKRGKYVFPSIYDVSFGEIFTNEQKVFLIETKAASSLAW